MYTGHKQELLIKVVFQLLCMVEISNLNSQEESKIVLFTDAEVISRIHKVQFIFCNILPNVQENKYMLCLRVCICLYKTMVTESHE